MNLYLVIYLYDPGFGISPSIQRLTIEGVSTAEALSKYQYRIMNGSPRGHYSLLGVSCLRDVSKRMYSEIKDMEVEYK